MPMLTTFIILNPSVHRGPVKKRSDSVISEGNPTTQGVGNDGNGK